MALRSIELFAGGGGLALGLERVGVRTVCFVEREAYAAAVLAARMGDGSLDPAPIWSDVCTFDGRPWRGVVDLVAGGFPCTDVSHAGTRTGLEGEHSGLWREFARVLREVRPRFAFVENVAALALRGLDDVLCDLALLGFDAEWVRVRASDAGAPHRRERLFILADSMRDGLQVVGADRSAARPTERSRGTEVADPDERRREIERHTKERNDAHGRRGVRPLGLCWADFPPLPQDEDGWREYLKRFPGTQPSVRRGADGVAHRVDRLRMLGNGVVPDQAEFAWRVLWDRLHE